VRVVHCKHESYTRFIGRGSIYGNPFTHLPLPRTRAVVQVQTLDESVDFYEDWLRGDPRWARIEPMHRIAILRALTSNAFEDTDILGCYCRPAHRCHGDVLDKLYQEFRQHGRIMAWGGLECVSIF
jgi:hypothetical protein